MQILKENCTGWSQTRLIGNCTYTRTSVLTLWPWNWTFKQQHIIYENVNILQTKKGNVMKYMTFCRGKN